MAEQHSHAAKVKQLEQDSSNLRATKTKLKTERAELLTRTASTKEAMATLEADRKQLRRQEQNAIEKEQELKEHALEAFKMKKNLEKEKQKVKQAVTNITVPAYWQHKDLNGAPHQQTVPTCFMVPKVQALIRQTAMHQGCLDRPSLRNATVTRVERVENTRKWLNYCHKRAEMQGLSSGLNAPPPIQIPNHETLDASLNEVYLFHGTSPDTAALISQVGFDERVANTKGLYGAGTYFAENSCKSMQYTRSPNANGEYTIIYSRVLLGHAYRTSQSLASKSCLIFCICGVASLIANSS